MKLSVSLPATDVEFIDDYAHDQGIDTRSAVLHKAIRLLRAAQLGVAYEGAWDEWSSSGEADDWETPIGDGLERS
jgi:Arc/MetJ-type ribon-helix-helix transcriptional regulator